MAEGRGRRTWRWVRWGIYVAIVAFLWIHRPDGGRPLPGWVPGRGAAPTEAPAAELVVAGSDLAPDLVSRWLAAYARDYPHLRIETPAGGTNRALEALGSGGADAAFLSRMPTPEEQARFREARSDTVLWFPAAIGGLVLLVAEGSPVETITGAELRSLAAGAGPAGNPRWFASDPNRGTWAALRAALAGDGIAPGADAPASVPGVTFLAGPTEVVEAVRADPGSVGLVSTLALTGLPPAGTRAVPLAMGLGHPPVSPTYESIGTGEYPLHHRLLVACLPGGNFEAAKLVTHLVSDRGQRQAERAGRLPARRPAREIRLDRNSPDERSPS